VLYPLPCTLPCSKASCDNLQQGLQPEDLQSVQLMQPVLSWLQVYSFGVTLWQILERKRPFEGMEAYQVFM
jgi:hypothetical protein